MLIYIAQCIQSNSIKLGVLMKKTKVGLVINSFSLITNDHIKMIEQAASDSDILVFAVGSSRNARNMTSPFTFNERKHILEHIMSSPELREHSYRIVSIEDHPYDGIKWVTNVHSTLYKTLDELMLNNYNINVYAFNNSSRYTKMFPSPTFNVIEHDVTCQYSEVMEDFFIGERELIPSIVRPLYEYLTDTSSYHNMVKEYMSVIHMKSAWANAPFPPTFVTTDAVVYTKGHILVVNRNSDIGKGLYCLPGGFLSQSDSVNNGIVRNLKKDTNIKVASNILDSNIVNTHVFDDPMRSPRGRILTTAGLIVLDNVSSIDGLPRVKNTKGNKTHAQWVSLYDIEKYRSYFFEDHYHIVKFMLSQLDNSLLVT